MDSISGVIMSYTVNKLAKLSGVSVRTLHFYDEMKYADLAMYAVGSLSTLIELNKSKS